MILRQLNSENNKKNSLASNRNVKEERGRERYQDQCNSNERTGLLTYSMEQSPSWEANQSTLQLVKKFPAFMEPESPSPYPQVPATRHSLLQDSISKLSRFFMSSCRSVQVSAPYKAVLQI